MSVGAGVRTGPFPRLARVREAGTHEAEIRDTYHPLLGTNVEIGVRATAGSQAEAESRAAAAGDAALAALTRLEDVFSTFRPHSELSRWRAGEDVEPSPDLAAALALGEDWWRRSGGALHPAAGALTERWRRAAAEGREPAAGELAELVASLATLPFDVRGGVVRRTRDCSGVSLYAFVKGYIVDQAVAAAWASPGVISAFVNAGGDLRHRGTRPLRVGVEDPAAVGGPPLRVVEVADAALATSGPVHRGFRVGGRWYGHVLDPRTGRPVARRPSTTVRAADAATADALATVLGVRDPADAGRLLAELDRVAVIAVLPDRVVTLGQW